MIFNNDICKKLNKKNNVINEIDNLKNSANIYLERCFSIRIIKRRLQLFNWKIYIKKRFRPDINYFINNYKYPLDPLFYSFSLKELYHKLLERTINITINNNFLELKDEWIFFS